MLRTLFFLICINELPQTLNETGSYLYVEDTFYQDKDVEKVEVLNKDFLSLYEWFIDNKLSVHFRNDKTKIIFFFSNENPTKTRHVILGLLSKTAHAVEYLGCYDYNQNEEPMAGSVLKKINIKIISYGGKATI